MLQFDMTTASVNRWLKALTYIGIYGGLLMPLVFVPIVIFPFVFSKLLFFQFLIGLTFPAYVAWAWIDPTVRPRKSPLYFAIAASFVAIGISTIFSVDPLRSWWGNQERMNGLFTLLHFFAWLTMTTGVLRTWPQWQKLLKYQVVLSVIMAAVSMLQKPFPRLLLFQAGPRIGGLLDNPIYMGAYQIFNLFFITLLWLKGATRREKIWYAIAAVCDIIAFALTQSRGALVGLAAGIAVFAVSYALMTPNRKAKRFTLAAAMLCFVAYGVLFSLRNTEFIQSTPLARFTSFSSATTTRFIAWKIAWQGFVERPLTGWGFDAFHVLFNEKYNPQSLRFGYYETWFDRSHNTIMDILAMTGILGLITFVAIFGSLFWLVIRARKRGWNDPALTAVLLALPVAYFVQNLFVFDHPAAFSMSYLLYALVIAATAEGFSTISSSTAVESSVRRTLPWFPLAVLYAGALFMMWRTSWLPMRASIISIKSNNAFVQGRYEEAFAYAKQAAEIPTPYGDEQTFLQSRNLMTLALSGQMEKTVPAWKEWHDLVVDLTEEYLRVHPNNAHPHFIYARLLQAFTPFVPEDANIAEREYRRAIELSPKRQQLYYSFAEFLTKTERKDEATEFLQQAAAFDEEIGESQWTLGNHLWFERNKPAEAAPYLIRAHEVAIPYAFRDAREVLLLAFAYELQGQKEKIAPLLNVLTTLPQAPLEVYLEIAKIMERQGFIDQRNLLLGALVRLDPTIQTRLMPLIQGSVTSIAASFAQTSSTPAVAPVPSSTVPLPMGGSSGSGPRR